MLDDLVSLFYPKTCAACSNSLLKHEEVICNQCYIALPKSNFHKDPGNPLAKVLEGRFPFVNATGYYLFRKKSKVQNLLHELKYKNNPEAGIVAGAWFGAELAGTPDFSQCDFLLPVPLHPKRLRQRGYNQSEKIALGMSEQLNIPLSEDLLYRKVATNTQTKKDKGDRWANVENIFDVKDHKKYEGKMILLVDDVITTGATIEACARSLQQIGGVRICIAALAFAGE
ncbi:MAG: amidophosphoribosyltransferase [Bacteroidetes bacterium]|jgi:ComF family protein|nr:amidophosphoribosyltransferase [Bacteroidota bacterium]